MGFFFKIFGNIFLNLSVGECVIFIKIGYGDFMILVGKWIGFVWGKIN